MRLFLAMCVLALPMLAGVIPVDGGWYGFCFDDVGSPAVAGCQNDGNGTEGNPFSFIAVGPVLIQITDAFDYGDQFSVVIDAGAPILTSFPGQFAPGAVTNPDLAFADPDYSKISIPVGPGLHFFDIFVELSPFQGGAAYVRVISDTGEVPEPSSLMLLGGGLAVIAFARRRRVMH